MSNIEFSYGKMQGISSERSGVIWSWGINVVKAYHVHIWKQHSETHYFTNVSNMCIFTAVPMKYRMLQTFSSGMSFFVSPLFFYTGSNCVAPGWPETHFVEQVVLNSQGSICLWLLSTGIKGMHHNTWLFSLSWRGSGT